jgi:hypothetical protein
VRVTAAAKSADGFGRAAPDRFGEKSAELDIGFTREEILPAAELVLLLAQCILLLSKSVLLPPERGLPAAEFDGVTGPRIGLSRAESRLLAAQCRLASAQFGLARAKRGLLRAERFLRLEDLPRIAKRGRVTHDIGCASLAKIEQGLIANPRCSRAPQIVGRAAHRHALLVGAEQYV